MDINQHQIEQLLRKLAELQAKQDALSDEYKALKLAILSLQTPETASAVAPPLTQEPPLVPSILDVPPVYITPPDIAPAAQPTQPPVAWDMERFIGENLSNKVGAFITVLGVGIGVKYAIDNNLIGPLTRILLGYAVGVVLFFVSYRLRPQYRDLSAVILSAAVCIAYFSTYAANIYFDLIPASIAFLIMLGITVVTVWQALEYDRQVIAVGGLVGAYAIPFLLNDGTEQPLLLFSYIAVVNCGILYISFWRNWKVMHVLAFLLTWLIFSSWSQGWHEHAIILFGVMVGTLYFAVFSAMYFAEKWIRNTPYTTTDSVYLILNGMFYYATGAFLLESSTNTAFYAFVMANVLIYLGLSYLVFWKNGQQKPFGLFTRAALFFLNVFLVYQFDSYQLVLAGSIELVLLFYIGRKFRLVPYETAVLTLGTVLLLGVGVLESIHYFSNYNFFATIWNTHSISFLTAIAALVALYVIHQNTRQQKDGKPVAMDSVVPQFDLLLQVFIGLMLYLYGYNEISHHFNVLYQQSYRPNEYPHYFEDFMSFKKLWILDFTLIYCIVLNGIVLRRWVQLPDISFLALLNLVCIALFLTLGLYELGYLKNLYLSPDYADYKRTGWHLGIRYLSLGLLAVLCWSLWRIVQQAGEKLRELTDVLPLLYQGVALWVVSSELVQWMEWNGLGDRSYKIALSILFGCWSVMLVILGIRKQDKPYRVAAILLFSGTLLKLFFYDLNHLSTIAKTIVMVSLGGLLLFISYLYNKFKEQM